MGVELDTSRILVGTAGWNIPRASAGRFGTAGSHLERYAHVLSGVEINTSFYRSHAHATYARWADSTPPSFRFATKVPRAITHELRLTAPEDPLDRFLAETSGLHQKRGPLLVQIPPSLAFDASVASAFFDSLRSRYEGRVVFEPRHASWMAPGVNELLTRYEVARVAADPPRAPGAGSPGGWSGIVYFRLHGSPRTYWSRYSLDYIQDLARAARKAASTAREVWCVFDNTASGAAVENACELQAALVTRVRGHTDR